MVWKTCQYCHGNGQVYLEVRPGVWEWVTCTVCKGTGGVDTGTI